MPIRPAPDACAVVVRIGTGQWNGNCDRPPTRTGRWRFAAAAAPVLLCDAHAREHADDPRLSIDRRGYDADMSDPSTMTARPADRDTELVAFVAMLRSTTRPWHDVASLIETTGTAHGLVAGTVPPGTALAAEVTAVVDAAALDAAAAEVASWRQRDDLTVWSVLDDDYPAQLRTIYNRPPLLFCRGQWRDEVDSEGLAVVGSRTASPLGLRRARRMAHELAERGMTVLSGLAVGVDGAAHTAALDAGGRTIAVLGSGLDHIYPAAHRGLADRIVDAGGALLSQFVPGQRPSRATFPMRNITMSGLSRGTVVIEAGATSGSRLQARVALEHGRPVFLLRSLVDAHQWARDLVDVGRYGATATVVADFDDILAALSGPAVSLPAEPRLDWTA